jgi:hypothetical protein
VELSKRLQLKMPQERMLCTLWIRAYVADGTLVARNYIQFFVDAAHPEREESQKRTVIRIEPHEWSAAEWNLAVSTPKEARMAGSSWGGTRGFFEWKLPVSQSDLEKASRLSLLCEASAFREGTPQTDAFAQPTSFCMLLNGVSVYRTVLPNHPHDARGALSYLRGGRGAYGYLSHATIEGDLLTTVKKEMKGNRMRLRCLVPIEERRHGGLTIYGSACGRYPIGPTLILE